MLPEWVHPAADPPGWWGAIGLPMLSNDRRPAWLNWLFLLMFLWSSWQLAGYWLERVRG
jgi:hypothetical protein